MLYLAIDQHRKQLTVNLRNEQGDVLVRRQVSTEWPRVRSFLDEVRKMSVPEGGFVAILEVCGFNDWLLKLLAEYGCRETILIQPEKRSKKKTDRRDAYHRSRVAGECHRLLEPDICGEWNHDGQHRENPRRRAGFRGSVRGPELPGTA